MLAANGVEIASSAPVKVGPKRLLHAPPEADGRHGEWVYVQPDPANLRELRAHLESVAADMQRLAIQPVLSRSASAPATEVALAACNAHSALHSWALTFEAAIERALRITTRFLPFDYRRAVGDWEPRILMHTDFASEMAEAAEAQAILNSVKSGVISKATAREELQRRDILGPAVDIALEDERLALENGGVGAIA